VFESGTGKGSPSGGPVSRRTGGASIEGLMGKLGLLGFRLFFLDLLLVSRWEKSASSWIKTILSSLRNRKREESESDGERQKASRESQTQRKRECLADTEHIAEYSTLCNSYLPQYEASLIPSCVCVLVRGLFPIMEVCFLFISVSVSPTYSLFYFRSCVSTKKQNNVLMNEFTC